MQGKTSPAQPQQPGIARTALPQLQQDEKARQRGQQTMRYQGPQLRSCPEAVFPAVEAVAAKLTRDGLDAVIEGSHSHGALITRLLQLDRDVTVRPVLLTVESLPQRLDHITEKEQQRAPGSEPRNWQANAQVLMTIQDFLICRRSRVQTERASWPILQAS